MLRFCLEQAVFGNCLIIIIRRLTQTCYAHRILSRIRTWLCRPLSGILFYKVMECLTQLFHFSIQGKVDTWKATQGKVRVIIFFPNIPNIYIGKSVEQQQQQEAQVNNTHFSSRIVPTFCGDLNFSTSSLSSREPLQSKSSSTTNMPSFSHTPKNPSGEASAKAAPDFVHLQDYDARVFQESHNVQHNVNYELNHSW